MNRSFVSWWAAVVLLVSMGAAAERPDRIRPGRMGRSGVSAPDFTFAPASGLGLPNGTKGEVLTTTRASSYACGSPLDVESTVVTVGNDTACFVDTSWTPSFKAYTVTTIRSSNWTTGWTLLGTSVVTADVVAGPDGLQTADQLHINATTGTGQAYAVQNGGCPSGVASGGVYVQTPAWADAGVIDFSIGRTAGTLLYQCISCSHVRGSWTRCYNNNWNLGSDYQIVLGNLGASGCAAHDRPAQDVYVARANCVNAATSRPSMETTAAAVPVAANSEAVAYTTPAATSGSWATDYRPREDGAGQTAFQAYFGADDDVKAYSDGSLHITCDFRIGGVSHTVTSTAVLALNASNRVSCYSSPLEIAACIDGFCTTGVAHGHTLPSGATTWYLGTRSVAGNEANGYVRNACYDDSATVCR